MKERHAIKDDALELVARGLEALGGGDPTHAAELFGRALLFEPANAGTWLHAAMAQKELQDEAGVRAALEQALSIDPGNIDATVGLAEHFERQARPDIALRHWEQAAAAKPPEDNLCTSLAPAISVAAQGRERARLALEARVDEALLALRAAHPTAATERFDACVDSLLGRGDEQGRGAGSHVPGLPQQGFYALEQLPWLRRLEAHTAEICAELSALLAAPEPPLVPYVHLPVNTGEDEWAHLDQSLDWAAIHLWRHGERVQDVCERCPRTAALLDSLPLMHLAGRAPNVSFAVMQPGTRLPPHVGTTNIRAVIHLPLIVPENCALRVGGETRSWHVGDAFAFDDTVEHEAWNLSDRPRVILIADAWNPHLTAIERDLLIAFAGATYSENYDVRGLTLGR